jgi:aminopeptidase-like protein
MSGFSFPSNLEQTSLEMHRLIAELYPICRSITGQGFRDTLAILQRMIPLEVRQVPSGTAVLDWTVPNEWNIRDAWVKNPRGDKVIDFTRSNLHVLNYSAPVQRVMPLAELKQHLYSLPEHPDWIPYRTSYYKENWGFCLRHNDLLALEEGDYEVCIDSTLAPGNLAYGELYLPGEVPDEVLVSAHACHPSLCNDNLSGVALAAFLAREIAAQPRRYSYRFLFIPGTIGSITWLALNEDRARLIRAGLVAACAGDPGKPHYKRSRRGSAEIDRAAEHVLRHSGEEFEIEDFSPYGYDERQYCSPGFNLAVGVLSRTPHWRFPEYHTSADDLSLVTPPALADTLRLYLETFSVLEGNRRYRNTHPKGEPQLSRRGLYSAFGGRKDADQFELALLWVLNQSDGEHDLLAIAERSGMAFGVIAEAASALIKVGLLEETEEKLL